MLSERIKKLREESVSAKPSISSERAELITEFYQKQESRIQSIPLQRAMAIKYILEAGENGADIIVTTPERHDELMTLVQALNHLNSITMGMILRESGVDLTELKRFATPMFHTKLDTIEKIFTNNSRLYAEIITLNPNIHKILDLYEKTLSRLKSLIDKRNKETLMELIKERSIWES